MFVIFMNDVLEILKHDISSHLTNYADYTSLLISSTNYKDLLQKSTEIVS